MAVAYEDFVAWKASKVTEEFTKDCQLAAADVASQILGRRDANVDDDQFCKGYLQGVSSILGWQPEFEKKEEESEDVED